MGGTIANQTLTRQLPPAPSKSVSPRPPPPRPRELTGKAITYPAEFAKTRSQLNRRLATGEKLPWSVAAPHQLLSLPPADSEPNATGPSLARNGTQDARPSSSATRSRRASASSHSTSFGMHSRIKTETSLAPVASSPVSEPV